MHNIEQARELWCPMVRIARVEPTERLGRPDGEVIVAGCNTDALGGIRVPTSCRCIADGCAMWRWVPGGKKSSRGGRHPNTSGFCGLAGTPAQ